jgi:hypothetical protein
LGFTFEAGESISISGELFGQDLERDVTTQLSVAGSPHLSHAALTKGDENFVGTEARANC